MYDEWNLVHIVFLPGTLEVLLGVHVKHHMRHQPYFYG